MSNASNGTPNVISKCNWTVHYRMTESAGLMIYLTDYRGHRIIWEAELPYVTIDHQAQDLQVDDTANHGHGPFWVPLGHRTQASEIACNEFRGGFELTVDFSAGVYEYTQIWRFHEDGRLAPWLTIHGGGLHAAHTYHPHWRFDFDVDGAGHDAVERFDDGRWNRVAQEGWFPYTGEADTDGAVWRQIDFGSGASVSIRPHHWEDAELFAIEHRMHDAAPSPHSAAGAQTYPAAYVGNAALDGIDVALWYVAHVHYDDAFPFTAGPWLRVDGF